MPTSRFALLARPWSQLLSRRTAAGALGLSLFANPALSDASKRKRKTKKPMINEFNCVNVGGFCKNSAQCCSGICTGKQQKRRCEAHNTGGCLTGQDNCEGIPVRCNNGTSDGGLCLRTTGAAGYCFGILDASRCFACQKDADCVPFCGPRAACAFCSACRQEEAGVPTACVGPVEGSCVFN